jgi:hypothetical protein
MPYGRVVWEPYPARDEIQIVLPDYLITEESMNGFAFTKVQQYHSDLFLIIYDVYGGRVNDIEIPDQSKSIEFDVSDMSTGLHIAVLYLDGVVISSGKYIVED